MRKWVGMSVLVARLECPSGIVILTDGYRPVAALPESVPQQPFAGIFLPFACQLLVGPYYHRICGKSAGVAAK